MEHLMEQLTDQLPFILALPKKFGYFVMNRRSSRQFEFRLMTAQSVSTRTEDRVVGSTDC